MSNYYHINKQELTIISGPHDVFSTYVKKLTGCGNPDLLDLSLFDLVPEIYPQCTSSQKYGDPIVYADRVEFTVIDKTVEELAAEIDLKRQHMSISRRQGDLILYDYNLYDTVQAVIASLEPRQKLEATTASAYDRLNPVVLYVTSQAGMTPEQVDQMFEEASLL